MRLQVEALEDRSMLAGASVSVSLVATDLAGQAIASIDEGQDFVLQAWVQDVRGADAPQGWNGAKIAGVFASYLHVAYSRDVAEVVAGSEFTFGVAFDGWQRGDASTPGWILNAGAFHAGVDATGSGPLLLWSVKVHAKTGGTAEFAAMTSTSRGLETLIFGQDDAVSPDAIEFHSASIVVNDVDGSGSAPYAPLPTRSPLDQRPAAPEEPAPTPITIDAPLHPPITIDPILAPPVEIDGPPGSIWQNEDQIVELVDPLPGTFEPMEIRAPLRPVVLWAVHTSVDSREVLITPAAVNPPVFTPPAGTPPAVTAAVLVVEPAAPPDATNAVSATLAGNSAASASDARPGVTVPIPFHTAAAAAIGLPTAAAADAVHVQSVSIYPAWERVDEAADHIGVGDDL